ncbi:MAG TPA: hypothetical protein PKM63_04640 [Panacibacter sp.]|nr:hypothetical protein [Panacibacter sp.]HNP43546.1 hypothetical protein [Panacibacter sp.]
MVKKICIACIVFMYACQRENNFTPVLNIPPEFQPCVDSFVAAALQRGHTITVNNLIIMYDSSLSGIYCANSNVTSSKNDIQKIISINPNIKCWQNSSQLETLIFHELGHCILGREHTELRLPNGDAKSIMYPDDLTLYSPCAYPIDDSCNQLYKRDYYLDELFDPATPVPGWGK